MYIEGLKMPKWWLGANTSGGGGGGGVPEKLFRVYSEALLAFLAAVLSFLWAFWWPPSAWELWNFLEQNKQGKTLVAESSMVLSSFSMAVNRENGG